MNITTYAYKGSSRRADLKIQNCCLVKQSKHERISPSNDGIVITILKRYAPSAIQACTVTVAPAGFSMVRNWFVVNVRAVLA